MWSDPKLGKTLGQCLQDDNIERNEVEGTVRLTLEAKNEY